MLPGLLPIGTAAVGELLGNCGWWAVMGGGDFWQADECYGAMGLSLLRC